MTTLSRCNEAYGIAGQLSFSQDKGDMPVAKIENSHGQAVIALQGAHVQSFQAQGQAPLIWMSDDAVFAPGKALRGGVPICWPWFGAHSSDNTLPAHGSARTADWQPVASASLENGSTQVSFELIQSETTQRLCPQPLRVQLHVTVGSGLRLELETTNLGDSPFTLGQALHTYFQVGDVRQAYVEGLDGCTYMDKVNDYAHYKQHGAIHIASEVDRVYLDTGKHCEIIDPSMQRKISITSAGSASTVVWNPWRDTANKMGDLGNDGYLNMLCVETSNTASDVIQLEVGATHRLLAEYTSQIL